MKFYLILRSILHRPHPGKWVPLGQMVEGGSKIVHARRVHRRCIGWRLFCEAGTPYISWDVPPTVWDTVPRSRSSGQVDEYHLTVAKVKVPQYKEAHVLAEPRQILACEELGNPPHNFCCRRRKHNRICPPGLNLVLLPHPHGACHTHILRDEGE